MKTGVEEGGGSCTKKKRRTAYALHACRVADQHQEHRIPLNKLQIAHPYDTNALWSWAQGGTAFFHPCFAGWTHSSRAN